MAEGAKAVKMRAMENSRFSIFEAAMNAYVFAGKEFLYLLKAGLLPMTAQILTALFIQFERPAASQIEAYLWGRSRSRFYP